MKSDEQLLSAITHGVMFSPMHAWGHALTWNEREDVVAYIRLLVQQAC
jgi:mono/diheme cytochrome c family protein